MAYEDPMEAALRSLTDVEWTKRKETFETQVNHTHMVGITHMLEDHKIPVTSVVSTTRSGRYVMSVLTTDTPAILKAVKATGAEVKPHRRKWQS
jgi:hypothetical protein